MPGFPACAGIDPTCARRSGLRWRLPRVRGDRPKAAWLGVSVREASPRARGSTRMGIPAASVLPGFPACAGIDLPQEPRTPRCPGLPRVRGDRPAALRASYTVLKASPRARGSTLIPSRTGFAREGFPACAGIDPFPAGLTVGFEWLPRVRGDRPVGWRLILCRTLASPRARGSTRARSFRKHHRGGFPACAGIDPGPSLVRPLMQGLPRVRGDRPKLIDMGYEGDMASPRARGSTRRGRRESCGHGGFPACAGIDLSQS